MMRTRIGGRATGVLRWSAGVLLWMVILGVTAAVAAAVLVPRLGGATPYTILTGSMSPTLPAGTLVVVKPVPVEQVGIGTVVTYQLESGKPVVVTHRVVATGVNADGETTLRTQGDANDVVDAAPVLPVQVKGRLWYAVPYLGHASMIFTGHQRNVAALTLAAALALYALVMFVGALRDRARRGLTPPRETPPAELGTVQERGQDRESGPWLGPGSHAGTESWSDRSSREYTHV